MTVRIFCAHCSDREFKVDQESVIDLRFLGLKCPQCEKITTLAWSTSDQQLYVLPGVPKVEGAAPKQD
jgi:hypothetical protein